MKNKTSINKIQAEWDQWNEAQEGKEFVTEWEVHRLVLSGKETQLSQRRAACGRNVLLLLLGSGMLTVGFLSAHHRPEHFLFYVVALLWGMSLLALMGETYRLLLFYLIESPRMGLRAVGRMAKQVNGLERMVEACWPWTAGTEPRKATHFTPRTAYAAISMATMVACVGWAHSNNGDENDGMLIAKTDDVDLTPREEKGNETEVVTVANEREGAKTGTHTRTMPEERTPNGGWEDLTEDTHSPDQQVANEKDERAMDSKDGDEKNGTTMPASLPAMKVTCNQSECSVEKYYEIFCSNMIAGEIEL